MSHGALSAEAHETLATGMNRIKELCSGEGERTPKDLKHYLTEIVQIQEKQIASARFGVTVDYLNNANEIKSKLRKELNQVKADNFWL